MDLDTVWYGNPMSDWLVAAAILALSILSLWLLRRWVLKALTSFAQGTQTVVDDFVAEVLGHTKMLLLLLSAIFVASLALTLPPAVTLVIRRAAAIALVLQGGIWANTGIRFIVSHFIQAKAGEDSEAVTLVGAISFIGRFAVWALVLLLVLDNLGVEVTALLTGLGIGGIAVALATQNTLGDFLATLSIVLDKPFVIGDFVAVGDSLGTVEQIGLKTTRLRSLSGEQLILGNNDILASRVRNLGRMARRRAALSTGVTYDTPKETLAAIPGWIQEIVESHDAVAFDRCHLAEYGDYQITFETVYNMTDPDYALFMRTRQSILLQIHGRFEEEGVEFAYPTRVVYNVPVTESS